MQAIARNPHNPRLRRVPYIHAFGTHQWACWTGLLDCSPTGYGVTPFMAYNDWQAAQRLVAAKQERRSFYERMAEAHGCQGEFASGLAAHVSNFERVNAEENEDARRKRYEQWHRELADATEPTPMWSFAWLKWPKR